MNVLIISYQYNLNGSVASLRSIGLANSFAKQGHHVTVITSKELSMKNSGHKNINLIRIKNPLLKFLYKIFPKKGNENFKPPSKPTYKKIFFFQKMFHSFRKKTGILFLGRMPDIADFWYWAARKEIKKIEGWDVVISSYAPYASLMLGNHLKKEGRTQLFIADFRDPWTNHHLFCGIPFLRWIERKLENHILNKADLITTATIGIESLVHQKGFKNTMVVYNGFIEGQQAFFPKQINNNSIKVIHSGSLYTHLQDIEPFFEALSTIDKNLNIKFNMTFVGNEKDYVDKLITKYNLRHIVHHMGEVKKSVCENLLLQANIGISFDLNNQRFNGIIPVKLMSYIQHKLGILQVCSIFNSEAITRLKQYPVIQQCEYNKDHIVESLYKLMLSNKDNNYIDNDYYSQNICNKAIISKTLALLNE